MSEASPILESRRARRRKVAFFLPSLAGGGVARSFLLNARGFADHGFDVDLVLCRATGRYLERVDPRVSVVALEPEPVWRARLRPFEAMPDTAKSLVRPILLGFSPPPPLPYIASLARYLRSARPDGLFAAKTHTNLVAIWARALAGVDTRLVVTERSDLSAKIRTSRKWRWRYAAPMVGAVYPHADAIAGVSRGVCEDLAARCGIPLARMDTLFNIIDRPELHTMAREQPDHPWLTGGEGAVILSAGRLCAQKQFGVLIDAIARLRERDVRLVILGEGRDRADLEAKVRALGLTDRVALPGFVANPFAYMARASVFAFSSAWEGFGNALVEAMACGCPVVSTDCPSGPREILADGRYGPLVPVGDAAALAAGIAQCLDAPVPKGVLRLRAADFGVDAAMRRALELLFGAAAGDAPLSAGAAPGPAR